MNCTELQTLITAGATLLGALVGGGISAWVARQQASLSLRQSRLNIAVAERNELLNLSKELSQLKAEVSDNSLTPDKITSKLIDLFVSKSTCFLSHSYLFSKQMESEVENTLKRINDFIYKAKTNQKIDESLSKNLLASLPIIEESIKDTIRSRMREVQKKIDAEKD